MIRNESESIRRSVIKRGAYSKLYFKCSSRFYKLKLSKNVLYILYKFLNKFKKNEISKKIEYAERMLSRFHIEEAEIENVRSSFQNILKEVDGNLNIKSLHIPLNTQKRLNPVLIIEFFTLQYRMMFMNSDEKFTKNYKYPKLESIGAKKLSETLDETLEIGFDITVVQKYAIESLVTNIDDFLNNVSTEAISLLPVILMKSDDQQLGRNTSVIAEQHPSGDRHFSISSTHSLQGTSVQQLLDELINSDDFLNALQISLDEQKKRPVEEEQEENNFKFSFLNSFLKNDEDQSHGQSVPEKQLKFIVCSTLNITMASFLVNYFDDSTCKLFVSLSNELKFCYFSEKSQKLVFFNFDKLNFSDLNTIWTPFDDEIENYEQQKCLNNMIGVLNQCELVRLILIELMMNGILFKNDYTATENIDTSAEDCRMKPILIEKMIKRQNANIKLHIKYCFKTQHFTDIENDSTCKLIVVKQVLNELGLRKTSYFDRLITKRVCKTITKRSAQLTAILIATLFAHYDEQQHRKHTNIAIDGLAFKCRPIFNAYFEYYLNKYMRASVNYDLKISRLDYSMGAAYAAIFLLEMKLQEEITKTYNDTIEHLSNKKNREQLLADNSDYENNNNLFKNFLKMWS